MALARARLSMLLRSGPGRQRGQRAGHARGPRQPQLRSPCRLNAAQNLFGRHRFENSVSRTPEHIFRLCPNSVEFTFCPIAGHGPPVGVSGREIRVLPPERCSGVPSCPNAAAICWIDTATSSFGQILLVNLWTLRYGTPSTFFARATRIRRHRDRYTRSRSGPGQPGCFLSHWPQGGSGWRPRTRGAIRESQLARLVAHRHGRSLATRSTVLQP